VEVRDRLRALRPVRLGNRPRVAAMTYEELRPNYESDEEMARDLLRKLVVAEAAATIAQAHRVRAENKLAMAMPRRINRDREED
jgi:cephalosporin hydroxylase